jgi:hypothetical protein
MANKIPRANDQYVIAALAIGMWAFVGHWALVIASWSFPCIAIDHLADIARVHRASL